MSTLSIDFDLAARRALVGDGRGSLAADEIVVDLFCGGGGATQGIEDAGLVVHECVNHCPTAIATHERNHPKTNHRRGDVWKNKPAVVAAGRPVGLLWASPDCRHFSRARGAAPVSRRVRDLAWVVTRWAEDVSPRVIIVENVPELLTWGPIRERRDERGRVVKDGQGRAVMEPIPERRGETFRRWVNKLRRCGYVVEWRVLDAADYGAASRRKRLYVIARRDGAAITWPEVTHDGVHAGRIAWGGDCQRSPADCTGDAAGGGRDASEGGVSVGGRDVELRQRHRGAACGSGARSPRRSAADVIDWSDLGRSIFERPKPLADKTLARIAEGIRRYVVNDPRPFTLRVTQTGEGSGWKVSDLADPLPTQTARQDLAMVSPVLAPQNGGVYGQRVDEPGPTITTKGHQAVIAPVLATTGYGEREGQRPRCGSVDGLLGTCVDGVKQGLVSPVLMVARNHGAGSSIEDPIRTIAAGGQHHGLVAPVLQAFRGNAAPQAVDGPMPTITAGNGPGRGAGAGHALGMITPLLAHNTTHHTGAGMDELVPTVTTGGHTGLVSPLVVGAGGSVYAGKPVGVDRPLGTVKCDDRRSLAAACLVAFYGSAKGGRAIDEPLGTVTTLDRHGMAVARLGGVLASVVDAAELMLARARRCAALMWYLAGVEPGPDGLLWVNVGGEARLLVDILFRMLKPRELAAAMGFPASYIWPATQREAVRLIGNAVSPPQAAALVRAVLPGGRVGMEVGA